MFSREINDTGEPLLTFTAPDGTTYALNAVDGGEDLEDISEIVRTARYVRSHSLCATPLKTGRSIVGHAIPLRFRTPLEHPSRHIGGLDAHEVILERW